MSGRDLCKFCAKIFTALDMGGASLAERTERTPQGKCGAWRRHGEGFATVKKHICPTPIRIHIATRAFWPPISETQRAVWKKFQTP